MPTDAHAGHNHKDKIESNFNRTEEEQIVYEEMIESVDSAQKLLAILGWRSVERARRLIKRFV